MIALVLLAAAACGSDDSPRRATDAGAVDASLEDAGADAGTVDAGAEDGGAPDAGAPDAGPPEADAGGCFDRCPLPLTEQPESCAGACRVRDCNSYCGDVATPAAGYADGCEDASSCRRGLQCLARDFSADGTCFAFCRIGDDAYCDELRNGSTCVRYDDLRTPEDDVRVELPPGVGVCR